MASYGQPENLKWEIRDKPVDQNGGDKERKEPADNRDHVSTTHKGTPCSSTVSETGGFPKAWESYHVSFILNSGNKLLKNLDASKIIKPTIMQFLYTNQREETVEKLKKYFSSVHLFEEKMNVYVDKDPFQSEDYDNDDDILLNILNEMGIEGVIDSKTLQLPSAAADKVYAEIFSSLSENMFPGKVALYQGENRCKLHVVGKQENVTKVERIIVQAKQKRTHEGNKEADAKGEFYFKCDVKKWLHLGIEKELKNLSSAVKYQEIDGIIAIRGSADIVNEGQKLLKDFSSKIFERKLTLSPHFLRLAQNEATMNYINGKASEQKSPCYFYLNDDQSLIVSSLSEEMLTFWSSAIHTEFVEKIIRKSQLLPWKFYQSPEFRRIKEEDAGKIYCIPVDKETEQIVCTADVSRKIDKMFKIFRGQQHNFSESASVGDDEREQEETQQAKQSVIPETKEETKEIQCDDFEFNLFEVFEKEINEYFSKIERNIGIQIDRQRKAVFFQGTEHFLTGIDSAINKCFQSIFKFYSISDLSVHKIKCLLKTNVCEYVDACLAQKKLRCVWKVMETSVKVYALEDKVIVDAVHHIKQCVQEHTLKIDAEAADIVDRVLASDIIANHISRFHFITNKEKSLLTIVATDDVMPLFLEMVRDERDKATQKTELREIHVPVPISKFKYIVKKYSADLEDINKNGEVLKSNTSGFVLKGDTEAVKRAERRLSTLINNLHTCEVVRNCKSNRKHIQPGTNKWEMDILKMYDCCFDILDGYRVDKRPTYVDVNCWLIDNFHLHHVQGQITEVEADLILCPVNDLLDPVGPGHAIIQCGGKELLSKKLAAVKGSQDFKKVKEGMYIESSVTGSLNCSSVVYFILPEKAVNKTKFSKTVAEGMFSSLLTSAVKSGHKTVAVPLEIKDENILSACIKGLFYSKIKMEQSFFSMVGHSEENQFKLHIYMFTENDNTTSGFHQYLPKEHKSKKKIQMSLLQRFTESVKDERPKEQNTSVSTETINKTNKIDRKQKSESESHSKLNRRKQNMAQRPVFEDETQDQSHSGSDTEEECKWLTPKLPESLGIDKEPWKNFIVTVKKNVLDETEEKYEDLSSSISPTKMQFLLKNRLESLNIKLQEHKCCIGKVLDGKVLFLCPKKDIRSADEIVDIIISVLEEMVEKISSRSVVISQAEIADEIFEYACKHVEQEKALILNDGGKRILLIGEKTTVENSCQDLKEFVKERQKVAREVQLDDGLSALLLQNLEFENYFEDGSKTNFQIEYDSKTIVIQRANVADMDQFVKNMNLFLKSIISTKCGTFNPGVAKLIRNESVQQYLQKQLQSELKHFVVDWKDTDVVCHTRTEEDGKLALSVFKTRFQTITLSSSFSMSKEFKEIHQAFSEHCIILFTDDKTCDVIATNNVACKMLTAANRNQTEMMEKLNAAQKMGPHGLLTQEKEQMLKH